MDDLEFRLRLEIARLKLERDRLSIRAQRAESVLADVLDEIDGEQSSLTLDTAERVCRHRQWFVQNFAD
jgi:hypothetical protein